MWLVGAFWVGPRERKELKREGERTLKSRLRALSGGYPAKIQQSFSSYVCCIFDLNMTLRVRVRGCGITLCQNLHLPKNIEVLDNVHTTLVPHS